MEPLGHELGSLLLRFIVKPWDIGRLAFVEVVRQAGGRHPRGLARESQPPEAITPHLQDCMTLKRFYGPYTSLCLSPDMVHGSDFMAHLFLRARK